MSKPVKPPLHDYIQECAALLNLSQWSISVSPHPPESSDALAECRVISGQQVATIRLSGAIINATPDEQRSCILHELIHIHLWATGEVVEHAAPLVGTGAAHILEAAHDLAIERATDALSLVLAPYMPLPAK